MKLAMYVTEGSSNPKSTISEHQIGQGVANNAKFVVAKEENDKPDTVDNDIQLKALAGEV